MSIMKHDHHSTAHGFCETKGGIMLTYADSKPHSSVTVSHSHVLNQMKLRLKPAATLRPPACKVFQAFFLTAHSSRTLTWLQYTSLSTQEWSGEAIPVPSPYTQRDAVSAPASFMLIFPSSAGSDCSMAYQTPPSKLRAMPVKTKGASKTGSEKNTMPSKTTTKLDKFPKTKVDVALGWVCSCGPWNNCSGGVGKVWNCESKAGFRDAVNVNFKILACWSQIRSPRLPWEDTARTGDSWWRQKWTDQTSAWWMGCGARHSKLLERILVARVAGPPQNSRVEWANAFQLGICGRPQPPQPFPKNVPPKKQYRIYIYMYI